MNKRTQKKNQKLLAENKLLKGNLGRELRQELGRLPYKNQEDIDRLIEGNRYLNQKVDRNRYFLDRSEDKIRQMNRRIGQLEYELKALSNHLILTCGVVLFCTILWAIMLF